MTSSLSAMTTFAPTLKASGDGLIVSVSSIAGLNGVGSNLAYAAIKAGIDTMTRSLARALAPAVRVMAVSPGVVRTALWNNMSEADRGTMYRDIGATLPVGRVGEAHDIAQTYLYLLREGFSTGQVVVVDGGTVLV